VSLFNREKRTVIVDTPWVWGLRGASTTAGQQVTSETASRLMAWWRCKQLLADIVGGLPIDQYRESGGVRRQMTPSEFVLHPSNLVSAEEWRSQIVLSATDCGNAFAYITETDASGRTKRAEVVPPHEVTVTQAGFLAPPVYKISNKVVDPNRIMHFRAFGPAPGSVMGMSPLEYAKSTIGLGLAVRNFGSSWYASGGHPTSVLTYDQELTTDQASAAKAQFKAATQDDHVAAFGAGWKVEAIGQSPEAALFLSATNATAVDICGYMGVPPEMLGYASSGGGSVTYANREQRMLDFMATTLNWWIGRLERFISGQTPSPQFVKINVDALLRSDAATRWVIHTEAVRLGVHSVNDVRRLEDEEPIDGGDEYLWPPFAVKAESTADATDPNTPISDPTTGGAA
jgi:HK97 family phage portal protein